jgi:hypothetical protein
MNGPRVFVASICLMIGLPLAPACAGGPAGALEVRGEAVQPANAPVLLELVVRNTGPAPIIYWCAGPGEYPDGAEFTAAIRRTDLRSVPGRSELSNGQHPDGAGRAYEIAPGRALRFPAAVRPPLPPGEYDISVECAAAGTMHDGAVRFVTWPAMRSANAFHVTVRDDPKLLAARDARIVAQVREHDPFARHVASTWPRLPVREELVKDLTGDDIVAADRAADGLWGDRAPAGIDGPLVAKVILKHLQPPKDGTCDIGLMSKLMQREGGISRESPQVREAIGKLALARPDGPVRDCATAALGLHGTSVPNERVAAWLAPGHKLPPPPPDNAFLNTILGLARSADAAERRVAYRRLVDFPGNPAAIQAARAGLLDKDAEARKQAGTTLAHITRPADTRPAAPP